MGKRHASQYANFGSLQYDQWLGMKQKTLPEPPKPEEVPSEEK